MSQTEAIAHFLRRGKTLTALSARRLFDVECLRSRVHELRTQGVPIDTEKLVLSSGTRIARYRLAT